MFNRFSTALALTTLISLGSWGAIATSPTLAQGRSVHAQHLRRPRPTWRPRPGLRPRPRPRPGSRAYRPYRPYPGLSANRNRRLSFRVGARRSYQQSFYIGGISRDPKCPANTSRLSQLVPPAFQHENPDNQKSRPTDRTISERPTFFAYLPELSPGTAEFTLQRDEQRPGEVGDLFKGTVELQGKAGIVGVQLPDEAPALEVGETYFWHLAIVCNPEGKADKWISAEGWIERVADVDPTSKDPAEFYAEQGIWQDVLEMMAILRYENPGDNAIAKQWSDLMTSAQLANFADTPVVQIAVPF